MRCPKCGSVLQGKVCIKCGYMENGNYVKYDYDNQKSDLELYEKNYNGALQNKNLMIPFLLGSLYVTYKGHFIIGFLLSFLEFGLFVLVFNFFEMFAADFQLLFALTLSIILWIFVRFIMAGVLNSFVLFLDKKDIEKIKKKYKNYRDVLASHEVHGMFLVLMNILIYILIYGIYLFLLYS